MNEVDKFKGHSSEANNTFNWLISVPLDQYANVTNVTKNWICIQFLLTTVLNTCLEIPSVRGSLHCTKLAHQISDFNEKISSRTLHTVTPSHRWNERDKWVSSPNLSLGYYQFQTEQHFMNATDHIHSVTWDKLPIANCCPAHDNMEVVPISSTLNTHACCNHLQLM